MPLKTAIIYYNTQVHGSDKSWLLISVPKSVLTTEQIVNVTAFSHVEGSLKSPRPFIDQIKNNIIFICLLGVSY